ncbi:MAG: hypothetical protein RBR70_09115 [Arcobacter sp.]|jgi:formate-dependent nitrite reductase membrane component NrfD|uniref:hypothetical protein n=1 Tax=Arcobacter sp. TaxID=1872629 RepID=UPI002A7485FE|nr:hypothetical protein [Arcobacter sp.]MDY3205216.1 hypothetical protein [Arcobacter sp.]
MFRQVKSAVFWYYLFKFRKRVTFVALLLIIALFANIIYGDVVEYLKLKDKLQYLEIALISKWVIIIFNLVFSIYLLLTMFKNEEKIEEKKVKKEKVCQAIKEEKFTEREKEFLYKKKIRSKADLLVEK